MQYQPSWRSMAVSEVLTPTEHIDHLLPFSKRVSLVRTVPLIVEILAGLMAGLANNVTVLFIIVVLATLTEMVMPIRWAKTAFPFPGDCNRCDRKMDPIVDCPSLKFCTKCIFAVTEEINNAFCTDCKGGRHSMQLHRMMRSVISYGMMPEVMYESVDRSTLTVMWSYTLTR